MPLELKIITDGLYHVPNRLPSTSGYTVTPEVDIIVHSILDIWI